MNLFQKTKTPQQEILAIYDELCNNLVDVKKELGRSIAILSHIQLKLDNNADDIHKVSKALSGAEHEGAEADALILQRKLDALYKEGVTLKADHDRANDKIVEMKKAYQGLIDTLKELQERYTDLDLTISETKIKEIANKSYETKAAFDLTYKEFEDKAYHDLFEAIAMEKLDGHRVNDELTEKYMKENKSES